MLDLYCPKGHLAVELDGGQHFSEVPQGYERRRTAFLRRQGITVLRFQTDVVFREPLAVLEAILRALGGVPSKE